MVHSRRSNIDCMEDLCTYYVHIILPNPVTTLQRMCHCSHFTGRCTKAQRGGLLAQRPRDQNWTARNADPRSPSSEARELSSEGLCTDSSALRSAGCTAHMPRAPGLRGLRRGLLRESEIPQAKGAFERQKDLDEVR